MKTALEEDDIDLLKRLQHGDESAFRTIYERYHSVLFRNVMRLLHRDEESRDIVQEVFISLWEQRQTIDISRPVNGWLFTVSYHRTINLLKKNLRTDIRLQQIILDNETGAEPETQSYALLEEAIGKLSPQKKKVLELCKLQGKTYDKAATELGLSKYTVGEYLQEAMVFLRDYVRKHPGQHTSAVLTMLQIFF